MRRDDTIHDEHSSAQGLVQGSHAGVQVFRNETPRGSWRAELALGPADRITVDGRSAAHAVQHLLAVLPAALAARLQQSEEHTLPTIHAFHPSGCAVFLQVPSLEDIDIAITDLLRRGYRPVAPGDGRPCTPQDVPRCPTHRVPMEQRDTYGDTWYTYQVPDPRTGAPLACRGGDRRLPALVSPSHTGIAVLGLSGTIVP